MLFTYMCCPSLSTSGASVHFLIWNPDLRIDVTKHLLTNAYAAEVKTRLLDHPSDDAPEDEKYHGMYWEWWNRAHLYAYLNHRRTGLVIIAIYNYIAI